LGCTTWCQPSRRSCPEPTTQMLARWRSTQFWHAACGVAAAHACTRCNTAPSPTLCEAAQATGCAPHDMHSMNPTQHTPTDAHGVAQHNVSLVRLAGAAKHHLQLAHIVLDAITLQLGVGASARRSHKRHVWGGGASSALGPPIPSCLRHTHSGRRGSSATTICGRLQVVPVGPGLL
jgi:hypothetical protein